ncbi:MAG: amino acid ABC transporter substrate-binding protein [Betaproteobacteria bacterium]
METEQRVHCEKATVLSLAIHSGCIALVLFFSCFAQAAGTLEKIAQSSTINIGFRDPALPFSYLDSNKRASGYSIDICAKLVESIKRELKRTDITAKTIQVTSVTRLSAMINGEIDLECSSSAVTAERLKQVSFSLPVFIAAIRIMVREGSGIRGISNLTGKTVVTTRGTSSEKLFIDLNQLHSLKATLLLAKDHAESFAMLESGKADAIILDDVLLYSLRATAKEPAKLIMTRDALTHEPFSIVLRKDDLAFKKVIDAEITRLITSGEMDALYRKWFESPITAQQVNLNMPMSYMMKEFFKSPRDWQLH